MQLYLRVGDRVKHKRYKTWGMGEVIEEMHSSLDGGTCIVRVIFEDGIERSFLNDLENTLCCRYMGLIFAGKDLLNL